jgi:hypothetical protein
MKICRRCGATKPRDAFYADRSRPGGLQRTCKSCDRRRLDAADARAKAQPPPAPPDADQAALARFLAAYAEALADALLAAAVDGSPLVVAYLHEWLCHPCPGATDPDDGHCPLRFLAIVHGDELSGRLPAVRPAVDAWYADPAAVLEPSAAAAAPDR